MLVILTVSCFLCKQKTLFYTISPAKPSKMLTLLHNKSRSQNDCGKHYLAETVGFEPTCRANGKLISSQPRYDHFDTAAWCFNSIPEESPFVKGQRADAARCG
ncbi:hypothetical protein, partial [Phascolarctobacterium succinatutens]|uniref:hypothetical protein n=1 Tax=Phascolarctobacterium succinatutens TaxID=626940 RepID=UPI0026EB627D